MFWLSSYFFLPHLRLATQFIHLSYMRGRREVILTLCRIIGLVSFTPILDCAYRDICMLREKENVEMKAGRIKTDKVRSGRYKYLF